jgi:hypothetical protein
MQNEDGFLVEKVAREFVARLGPDAVPFLQEQAEIAALQGDALSACAWADIAEASERILQDRAAA